MMSLPRLFRQLICLWTLLSLSLISLNETAEAASTLALCPAGRTTSSGVCGEANGSGVLNEGDCVADNKIVTEITEPLGEPPENLGEDKIIDVYHGICCAEFTDDGTKCKIEESIYFDSLNACLSGTGDPVFCEPRQWIIADSGAGILKIYIKQIYFIGGGLVGFIAVTVLVVSGIQIAVSGVSGDISAAKDRIIQSLTGLVLLFLSGLILYTINPTFFS